jgi:hypothetical protein
VGAKITLEWKIEKLDKLIWDEFISMEEEISGGSS